MAQTKAEIRLALTQGESLLVTLGLPVLILIGFTTIKVLPLPKGVHHRTEFLVPGTLALAVMATGMVAQGISIAVDRTYGVLKRLGVTPLGRAGLLYAKITAILAVEVVQVGVLFAVGAALGWSPRGNLGLFVVAALLSTIIFTALGMLLGGTLKSEAMIGIANAIYLVFLFIGGMIFPVSSLPSVLQWIAKLLPPLGTSQIFFHTLGVGGSAPAYAWFSLIAWAIVTPLLAIRFFRWD